MSIASPVAVLSPLTIWRSVDEIDVAAWETVRPDDDLFMDVRFLRAVERSMSPQCRFWYLLFRDAGDRPVAIACLSTYVLDVSQFVPQGLLKRSISALGGVLPFAVSYKLLFCGIPFSTGQSHLRMTEDADPPSIIARLCRTMDRVARDEGAQVIVMKEFRDEECPLVEGSVQHGFRRADSPPMNVVRPRWNTFDEYLASLTSKQRWNIRHSLKKIAGGTVRIVRLQNAAEVGRLFTPAVHQLYAQVFERSETKVEFMPAEFFRQLAVELPDDSRYQFVMEGNRVLGFGVSIRCGLSYHPLLAGIDYSRNAQYDLYFNVMYDTFADAPASGVEEIHVARMPTILSSRGWAADPTLAAFTSKACGLPCVSF